MDSSYVKDQEFSFDRSTFLQKGVAIIEAESNIQQYLLFELQVILLVATQKL
jgi:hypothetical protein